MKYIRFFIILLLVPLLVMAEDCDNNDIILNEIIKVDSKGGAEETEIAKIENNIINLNLKMYEIGDSISYKVTISNNSNEDYMIDPDSFKTEKDYIEYSITTDDNTNIVKAKKNKDLLLTIKYKNELDNTLYSNGVYSEPSNIKLLFNTKEKKQEIKIITSNTTKNIKNPIKEIVNNTNNPLTSTYSITIISIVLIITGIIILLNIKYKKKYNKYLVLLISFIIMPTIYAICNCEIVLNNSIIIEKRKTLSEINSEIIDENTSCIEEYTMPVTDELGVTKDAAENVYFNKCVDKRNVIFGGYCWQMYRTTETGGIKMLYYGKPVDGKCEANRENTLGIVGSVNDNNDFSENYLYGDSFSYDEENLTFTLTDTTQATWSDSTYKDLIGKFTCKNTTGTCTEIYLVNAYMSNTNAYTVKYSITNTKFAHIGTSPFNAKYNSPAMVGYMFNNVYDTYTKKVTTSYLYGSSYTYNTNTNMYTLSGTIENINGSSNFDDSLKNTHYTCWNDTGTCETISYIHNTSSNFAYYENINDGKGIEDILIDMLANDNVNKYNSAIKSIIDAWYKNNLVNYTKYLEDPVYCANRKIYYYGGYSPQGSTKYNGLDFESSTISYLHLSCENETDQFSMSNSKAKLTYPIALLTSAERYNLYRDPILNSGSDIYLLSPSSYDEGAGVIRFISSGSGIYAIYTLENSDAIRPVITLLPSVKIVSGTGSNIDPFIIYTN